MELSVRVKMDARATMRALKGLQKEQFPYAYARALTETAKMAQIAVRLRTREEFKLHTDYIPRGVLVEFAKKSDFIRMGSAWSAVLTSRGISGFMTMHETGETKLPRGKKLTVPGAHFKESFKTTTGRVKMAYQPRKLLAGGKAKQKKGRLTRKAFILPGRGSQPPFIARRVRRGDRGLEILYSMHPRAKIRSVWLFEKTVRYVADRVFTKIFEFEFAQALRKVS